MTTRAIRVKPGPGEELIGTITPHGLRLTKAAWTVQRAYRSEQRRAAKAGKPAVRGWLPRIGTAVSRIGHAGVRRGNASGR